MPDQKLRLPTVSRFPSLLRDGVILARPVAALFAGAELAVGFRLTAHPGPLSANSAMMLRAGLTISLITAAVNTVNDIRDIDADAISRPNRPLAARRMSVPAAWLVAGSEAVVALALSMKLPAGLPVFLILLTVGVAYSYVLKGTVLVGNFVVAFLAASPIVYGAELARDRLSVALLLAVAIFLFMFSYEVLKTIRDVAGDRAAGYRTVAIKWGPRTAAVIFRGSLASYAVLATIPMLFVGISVYYIAFMCLGGVLPCVIASLRLPVGSSSKAVLLMLRVMAISWFPSLVALTLAFQG